MKPGDVVDTLHEMVAANKGKFCAKVEYKND